MDWTPHITTLADCAALLAEQHNLVQTSKLEQGDLAHIPATEQVGLSEASTREQTSVKQTQGGKQDESESTQMSEQDESVPMQKGGRDEALPTQKSMSELVITHLSYDSRAIEPGTLFFCKGVHFKPEYLVKAAEAGAVAYVSESDYSDALSAAGREPLPLLLVQDIRIAIADIAAYFYRGLLDNLTLIGFTGTKGKSTTTYMLKSILDSWLKVQDKPASAWLSSIENYDGATCERATLTTQETLELYRHFVAAVEHHIEYLTMEVSSQALKYNRTRNLTFEVGGFLNIGDDHISAVEHPTHEDYLNSKLKLFAQCHTAVVNLQSDESERVLRAAEAADTTMTFCVAGTQDADTTLYDRTTDPQAVNAAVTAHRADAPTARTLPDSCAASSQAADFVASHISSTAEGLSFEVQGPGFNASFTLPMAGLFNIENALAALTAASALGVPVHHMQEGLAHCEVSGRMQLVTGPDDKLIIIDYAHNKLSFETLFAAVSEQYPTRPIVCVFGATGGKGTERRLELPAVAAAYAHRVYVTEDDPGEEPLQHINKQIAGVLSAAGIHHEIIEDRDEAIRRAITEAPRESLVLILGKGHETVMKRGRVSVPVPSDRERVQHILSAES